MTRYIRYRGHLYVAALDMEKYRQSLDPLYGVDHIEAQLGEIRTVCRRCGKIMSTQNTTINRGNENQFKFNFAALRGAPKYVATQYGYCGCTSS